MMKMNALTEFFLLIISVAVANSNDCKVSKEAADKCGMKSVMFGNREAHVPTNDAELDAFCTQVRTNTKCVADFNEKCLTGKVQMAINIALNNGKKFVDKRCNNPKDRQEFLTHIKCLVPKDKIEHFHVCADKHLVMLDELRHVAKGDRVAALCCLIHMSQDCMRQQFIAHCGEDTTGYWDDSWDELTQDSMEFSCTEFSNLEKCEKSLPADALSKLKAAANSDDAKILATKHKYKSEVLEAVEIMEFFE